MFVIGSWNAHCNIGRGPVLVTAKCLVHVLFPGATSEVAYLCLQKCSARAERVPSQGGDSVTRIKVSVLASKESVLSLPKAHHL